MMLKWSSTKPPDHQTIRKRQNQRRHRQRVKDRVAELESQLSQAQGRIAELEGEVERLHAIASNGPTVAEPAGNCSEDGEDRLYALLPPPPKGKSTTICREAFVIIEQQNYKGMDAADIKQWLEPGFFGCSSEGEGCRVDNSLLFQLLDFMSSGES